MIVRQEGSDFVLIQQHEHARLAGWLAASWGNDRMSPLAKPRHALVLATTLHDIGWQALDDNPIWDEDTAGPYTFVNETVQRKLPQYRAGIDLIEAEDPYAGLLCSRHYTSFFLPDVAAKSGDETRLFVAAESGRQKRLRETLQAHGRDSELSREDFDLALLKLWDHISLYVCLNRPATPRGEEHPWYRDGFQPIYPDYASFLLQNPEEKMRFIACWENKKEVSLRPFPLRDSMPYALSYRQVSRKAVARLGFGSAYHKTEVLTQVITFVSPPEL
jgi:hypothetical protein